MNILAVDDDCRVLNMLRVVLSAHGYKVTTVLSAEKAMVLLAAGEFSLLLTDISMPGQDGNALARFAKMASESIPVVAVTGEPESASGPFDRILGKPVYYRTLIETVESLLEGRDEPVRFEPSSMTSL